MIEVNFLDTVFCKSSLVCGNCSVSLSSSKKLGVVVCHGQLLSYESERF